MVITIHLEEEQRQMMLLALAELGLERPGWDYSLREIAKKMDNPGVPMYERFQQLNRDRVGRDRGDLRTRRPATHDWERIP